MGCTGRARDAPTLMTRLHEEPVVTAWKTRHDKDDPACIPPPLQPSDQLAAWTTAGFSCVASRGGEVDALVVLRGQRLVVPGAFVVVSQQKDGVAGPSTA
jgi:hypothetical protein